MSLAHIKDAIDHYVPQMVGMTPPARCYEMAELVYETRPRLVVEIGVFGGVTAVSQAFALRSIGSGVIYGIDAWKVEPSVEGENPDNEAWWKKIDFRAIYQGAVDAVWDHHLEDWCVLLRARSQDVANLFADIDLLHIDGTIRRLRPAETCGYTFRACDPAATSGWMIATGLLRWPHSDCWKRNARSCASEKTGTTSFSGEMVRLEYSKTP